MVSNSCLFMVVLRDHGRIRLPTASILYSTIGVIATATMASAHLSHHRDNWMPPLLALIGHRMAPPVIGRIMHFLRGIRLASYLHRRQVAIVINDCASGTRCVISTHHDIIRRARRICLGGPHVQNV
jgi:hypothetical protein